MFRERFPFRPACGCSIMENVSKVNEKGIVVQERVDAARTMPPVDDFELQKLIDANIPLEQANTILFSGDSIPEELTAPVETEAQEPTETKTTTSEGVNNEE